MGSRTDPHEKQAFTSFSAESTHAAPASVAAIPKPEAKKCPEGVGPETSFPEGKK